MPTQIKSTFTGLTASIIFGDKVVGRLQDFAFTENNDMIPVRAIGSGVNVALVPTVKQYMISASRAFMYGDVFVSMLSTLNLQSLTNIGVDISKATGKDGLLAENVDTATLQTLFSNFGPDTTMIENDKAAQIYFDIKVNNSVGDDLYTFTNCLLTSRNTRISATGVVVLENVSLVSLNRVLGKAYEVTNGVNQ